MLIELVFAAAIVQQDDAKAVLGRLADRMREAKTFTARFTQTRRSALMEKPLVSSGRLAWRRDPEALAFLLQEPARSEVRFERGLYSVYRPADRQLERFELEDEAATRGLFAAFSPDPEKVS